MATLNIRLDDELKKEAFSVLEEQGISPSDFIRGVFKYVAEEKRLPVQLLAFDVDNYEATQKVWPSFLSVRDVGSNLVELFRHDKNIPHTELTLFHTVVTQFHSSINENVPKLIKAKEWGEIGGELQKLSYQLKYQALTSRLGPQHAMYSSDAINEFGRSFYGVEHLAHELMLASRAL